MTRSMFRGLSAAIALAAAVPAPAHHEIQAKFDPDQAVRLSGLVTQVDWANPHAHIFMTARENGEVKRWYVELESPTLLERNGWDAETLKPGDTIEVQGMLARDGSPQLWGNTVRKTGGQALFTVSEDMLDAAASQGGERSVPRWPDGQPRLGPPPGESGYWIPTRTVLMEEGVDVEMSPHGLLANIADAPRVAPLQEWALRLYEFRQRNFLDSDPTFLECRPPAGPRKYFDAFGIQLLEDRPLERVFVIQGGGNHDWHLIYTDGRPHDGGFQLDDGNLLYYGRGVGEWDGDTFVVETEGFNEKFWLPGGLPHTEQMHVTERLTRTDFDTLEYELTIDDPGAYTRPWSSRVTLKWLAEEPPEHYCQDNRL